jgi:hypothetical protein
MLEDVLAVPDLEDHLVLCIRQEGIRPRPANEYIAARTPDELVCPLLTQQLVIPLITP